MTSSSPKTVLQPGVLTLAATPIGNPMDASMRLVSALKEADLIAAEDTRRLKRLATDLGIRVEAQAISYHEHNEQERTPRLLAAARDGQRVLLVTDAGMPVVSDPGFRAVQAAHEAGIEVDVLPGPSAPLTALAHSGLAPDRFAFEGFLPRRPGQRRTALQQLAAEQRTLLFFESPRRTLETLTALAEVFGEQRQAAVARELTKLHQEVRRGSLAELVVWAQSTEVLGEIAIVVAGADASAAQEDSAAAALALVEARVASGMRLKAATKEAAAAHPGVSARELYEQVLAKRE